MVNLQQVQAINQTNDVNLQQMQQSSQVFAEPGLSVQVGGQQGYEPQEAGAPVDQVVRQQVQSQQQIERQQKQQQVRQQQQARQQQEQVRQQQIRQQQAQQQQQLQSLKRQEQQLREQIQKSQQQAQQQAQGSEESSPSMFSKYFIQTCFIVALVAGLVLYYLNQKGYLGKTSSRAAPPARLVRTSPRAAPSVTGGNLNNMFKYLFNN